MNKQTKASLRDRVLALAEESLRSKGQAQLSLRQIATELGVTPMAIYRHFANNEDLQLSLLDVGFRRFADALSRSQKGTTPLQRLEILADGFIEFAIENPGLFELMFLSSQVPTGLRNREALMSVSQPTFAMLERIARECIAAGDLPDAKPETMARDLLAFCVGQVALFVSGVMNWSADEAKYYCRSAFGRHLELLVVRAKDADAVTLSSSML